MRTIKCVGHTLEHGSNKTNNGGKDLLYSDTSQKDLGELGIVLPTRGVALEIMPERKGGLKFRCYRFASRKDLLKLRHKSKRLAPNGANWVLNECKLDRKIGMVKLGFYDVPYTGHDVQLAAHDKKNFPRPVRVSADFPLCLSDSGSWGVFLNQNLQN
jgi:hypothetical protein